MGSVYTPAEDEIARYLAEQKLRFYGEMPLKGGGKRTSIKSASSEYNIEFNSVFTEFIPRVDIIMYYPAQEVIITIPSHKVRIKTYDVKGGGTFSWEFYFEPVELTFSSKLEDYSKKFQEARQLVIDEIRAHINDEINDILMSKKINDGGEWKLSGKPVKVDFKWVSAL